MRYCVTFAAGGHGVSLPLDYREYLTAAVYRLLDRADSDYARFIHDEGYKAEGDGRGFKPFTYSQLMTSARRRRIDRENSRIVFAPGPISWQISSPVGEFALNLANGMLAEGAVSVGAATLPIESIQIMPEPRFTESMRFTCLSSIVAAVPVPKSEGGGTHFLRPLEESEAFSEAIRKNLIAKYKALNEGREPQDTRFTMTFDADYMARHNGGTKLTTFKGIHTVGAFAPFTVAGSVEMIALGYAAGFGSKTATGHGMVEVMGR